jgi:hypoxanthine phosphoribosyltransferase
MEKIVSIVILNKKNQMLLLKRNTHKQDYPNKWSTVSGHIEEQETVIECAERELREELGPEVRLSLVKQAQSYVDTQLEGTWLVHPLLFTYHNGKISLNHEHSEYQWIDMAELNSFDNVPGTKTDLAALAMDSAQTIAPPPEDFPDDSITLPPKVERILIPVEVLQARVKSLAKQIAENHQRLIVLTVLEGAKPFSADLSESLVSQGVKIEEHKIKLSSYKGTESTGTVTIHGDLPDLEEKHVLVVEDIVDTGLTIKKLRELLQTKKPKSIAICSLLHKNTISPTVKLEYVGFIIPDVFVVGYGLDHNEQFRELPYVGIFRET